MIPVRRIERINDRTIRVVPESGPYFEAEVLFREWPLMLANATFPARSAAIHIIGPGATVFEYGEESVGFYCRPDDRRFSVALVDRGPSTRWVEEAPTPEPPSVVVSR